MGSYWVQRERIGVKPTTMKSTVTTFRRENDFLNKVWEKNWVTINDIVVKSFYSNNIIISIIVLSFITYGTK